MRKSSIIVWLSATLLAACGGSSDTLTAPKSTSTGPTTTAAVAKVTLSSSTSSIAADGSTSATITAVAYDKNNNLVKGATMTFNASAGGLAVTQATTDANGSALATLKAGTAAAGTAITVGASTGGISAAPLTVNVVSIQQTLTLTTSSTSVPSNSSKNATLTALVRDANNNVLPGVTVAFTSDSGALAVVNSVTDSTGSAVANLNAGGNPTNRNINVTASITSASAKLVVAVTGTTMSITGPSSIAQGTSGSFNITLVDSSSNPITNTPVAVSSADGNALSAASVTTNGQGVATVALTATKGTTDVVTATALGVTANSQPISISTDNIVITAPVAGAKINLGAVQPVSIVWQNAGVNVPDGSAVTLAATRGTLAAGSVTTVAGAAQTTISSTIAGPATITATGNGVSASVDVDFISVSPSQIALQASPSTIPTGTPTGGQSTITATVRDPSNNLVEGQIVAFSSPNDVTGGTIFPATAVTNSQGQATTVYTATDTASSANGVTIQATVQGTSPALTGTTTLTVGGKTVFLSLGTGNVIAENGSTGPPVVLPTAFLLPYILQAVDSGGNPVPGIQVTLVIHSVQYGKGQWIYNGSTSWVQVPFVAVPPAVQTYGYTVCPNEDEQHNGVFLPAEDGFPPTTAPFYNPFGNKDGKLESGDVATVSPGVVTTDSTGSANLTIQYPEDHAGWIQVELTATATVTGTASSSTATFWLPMEASKLTSSTTAPPGQFSPYGIATVCTNPN